MVQYVLDPDQLKISGMVCSLIKYCFEVNEVF